MSTVGFRNTDSHFEEDANERESELIALARMVTYAKGMASDLQLDISAYCLDLSLKAIYEELGQKSIEGLPSGSERQAQIARKSH